MEFDLTSCVKTCQLERYGASSSKQDEALQQASEAIACHVEALMLDGERLLAQLDSYATQHGATRSGMIAEAAIEYLADRA